MTDTPPAPGATSGVTTFSLRPATTDDLTAVLAIEAQSYPKPWTLQHFTDELSNQKSNFLVYTDDATDERVAGYVVFWDLGTETHLLNVAVSLDWRGLGMGARLLGAVINDAYRKKHERVFLEVRVSNKGAIALYEKLGFQAGPVKKAFYEDGEDALFMTLALDGAQHGQD